MAIVGLNAPRVRPTCLEQWADRTRHISSQCGGQSPLTPDEPRTTRNLMPSALATVAPQKNGYENDVRRIVPYLLRFYTSSTEHAIQLNDSIMETLIGRIAWPKGSGVKIEATIKRIGRLRLLDHSNRDPGSIRSADLSVDFPLEMQAHPVDQALAQFGNFKLSLQQLYFDEPGWLRGVLRTSLPAAEAAQNTADGSAWRHLKSTGDALGWTHGELRLARFALHTGEIPWFAEWFDALPESSKDTPHAIARMLNSNANVLRKHLRHDGALISSGLYRVGRHPDRPFVFTAPPRLQPKLLEAIGQVEFDVKLLCELLLSKSPYLILTHSAFPHLHRECVLVDTLLRQTSESRERGINILIYGPPGTRKTDLARSLVSHAGLCAYEVPVTNLEEDGGGTLLIDDRLALLHIAHRLLRGATDTALLFDEAEDAFPYGGPLWTGNLTSLGAGHRSRSGSMNRLPSESPLPTIWISNAAHHTNPQFLWRFTYHLDVRRQR